MQRFRWVALQGSARGLLSPLLLLLAVHITTSGIPALAADDQAACPAPFARIVSIQGSVEVLRAGQSTARQNGAGQIGASRSGWIKVTRLDTPLCEGDRLRTGALSRAALFIQPETLVRVDQHTRISLSQTAEETLVEFVQEGVLPASATPNACGAGYFITRFPRKFKVNTPHLNAAVEGTEFLVAMRCETTELSVFEGKVLAASAGTDVFPPQTITSGQTLTIGGAEPPAIKLLVKPADAVQWVLYYPPLSDARAEAELPTADQCRSLPKPLDQTCLSQRAELLMRLGQIDQAQREIDEAVAMDSQAGEANALRAVILIARNDKAGALEAAKSATAATPNAYRTWLALSYAQQASFELEDSLESARKAHALEPNSSLTNARVAELLMSLGRIKEAELAARAAVNANPAESRAHTVRGFVHLAQIKTKEARTDFHAAIERDSSDPLPRLGLGLAIIRTGKLADGREQLEIAVALDPTNSLIRSYVGKAYYEENSRDRDQLAATQFDLAKQLDPNDPTPWFYEAILKQSQNQPVAAVRQLERSIERNGNRAVYRSLLLLDEDQAARSISVARTYDELGLHQPAISEAVNSLVLDPSNSSAHLFLSESLGRGQAQQISRVSELLVAQLLQPVNSNPIQPQAAFTKLAFLADSGPFRTGHSEYSYMFSQERFRVLLSGAGGSQNTWGDQVVLSGLSGPASFSVGQFHYETEGFRPNSDISHDIYDAYFQLAVRPGLDIQAEARSRTTESGDLALQGDPNTFDPRFRRTIRQDVARLGAHLSFDGDKDLLVSVIQGELRDDNFFPDFFGVPLMSFGTENGKQAETMFMYRRRDASFLAGAGGYIADTNIEDVPQIGPCPFPQCTTKAEGSGRNVFGQVNVHLSDSLLFVAGVSYDSIRDANLAIKESNPKIGIMAKITPSLALRAAAFQSVKPALIASQTLQPTVIVGFSQFSDDPNGTVSNGLGIALDAKFLNSFYAGAEFRSRSLDFPIDVLNTPFFARPSQDMITGYLHWMPAARRVVSVGYIDNVVNLSPDDALFFGQPTRSKTNGIPLRFGFFEPNGIFGTVTATSWRQRFTNFSGSGSNEDESFTLFDLALGYRLPRRMGIATLDINNVFDKSFFFRDTDFLAVEPTGPRLVPQRTIVARLTLHF